MNSGGSSPLYSVGSTTVLSAGNITVYPAVGYPPYFARSAPRQSGWEVGIQLSFWVGTLLIAPVFFALGARFSAKEEQRSAKRLRWLNVVGLAISVGVVLLALGGLIRGVVLR